MGRIDWLPIAELPEALKDGRAVLLHYPEGRWIDDAAENDWEGYSEPDQAVMRCDERGYWRGYYEGISPKGQPTHFAEINPPASCTTS